MELPPITLNSQFKDDFTEADAPCCALGLVRSGDAQTGLFAMKPENSIPPNVLANGLAFGHRMLASLDMKPICQFIFKFYGFEQYSVLVNPSNPLAMKAIEAMIEERDSFFLILNPNLRATVFRNEIGEGNLAGMRDNLPLMRSRKTPQSSYESGVRTFWQKPHPPDVKYLEWVCCDNSAYLDLENDTTDLPHLG